MKEIRVSAKTVADAIIEASIQLGTSSDNIEYEVIEVGSTGFFGIGSKQAVISAKKKKEYSDYFEEEIVKEVKSEIKPTKKPAKKETKKQSKKVPEKEIQYIEKNMDKNREAPSGYTGCPKNMDKNREIVKPDDMDGIIRTVIEFLEKTCKAMDVAVKVKAEFDEENNLNVDMSGDEMGILIGKRGQTLDSLQYLSSLVVNKGKSSYIRVKLDTENYRLRRKETLEQLAKNIAIKVKRTRRPVFLEPMNPYERRVIHSALQNDQYVSTHSEGEEPYRKVVITLKK